MQRGHEYDVISRLKFVAVFALQLPIGVIDENEDPRTSANQVVSAYCARGTAFARLHGIVQDEHLLPRVAHQIFTEPPDQICDARGLLCFVDGRYR